MKVIDTATFEGIRTRRYFCTAGVPTIGVGFNLNRADARGKIEALGYDFDDVRRGRVKITLQDADVLFQEDLQKFREAAIRLVPNFYDHPEIVQDILTDLTFNLGERGFGKFKNTRRAFKNCDYASAARGLRRSRWYKQVGRRSRIICRELRKLV